MGLYQTKFVKYLKVSSERFMLIYIILNSQCNCIGKNNLEFILELRL